jgi:hypothetical protein
MKKKNSPFRCIECGSSNFDVIKEFLSGFSYIESYPCHCGRASQAATRECIERAFYQSIGLLKEDHRFSLDDTEKIEKIATQNEEFDIVCHECFNEAVEGDLKVEARKEAREEDVEFYVRCAQCGREIEFGWSQPDRGGEIWPVDSRDFEPQKIWPEPRFSENWVKRGWLKPSDALVAIQATYISPENYKSRAANETKR